MPRVFAKVIGDDPRGFAMQAYEREIKRYFRSTVKPEVEKIFANMIKRWEHKPELNIRITAGTNPSVATGYGITCDFWVSGEYAWLWDLLSTGAEEHDIPLEPKEDGFLWFREQYDAITAVEGDRLLLNVGRGEESGALQRRKQVHHPGFEGRRFVDHFFKEYGPTWDKHVDSVLDQAMRATWRAR